MTEMDRRIMAQTAFKVAGWIHAAEVNGGAEPDIAHLSKMAKEIATGMKLLSGESSGSPSAGQAGGPSPQRGPSAGAVPPAASAPSCPKCNEPMEPNKNWTGLGDRPGHKKSESIKWRCSQRGRFVKDKGWSGCDGVKWEDAPKHFDEQIEAYEDAG